MFCDLLQVYTFYLFLIKTLPNNFAGYFHDLLAWALFTNRVEIAGVFWSKCKNQLRKLCVRMNEIKYWLRVTKSTDNKT